MKRHVILGHQRTTSGLCIAPELLQNPYSSSLFRSSVFWVLCSRRVCVLYACVCILVVYIHIQLDCTCMPYVCACTLVPKNPNPFLLVFLCFLLPIQPLFNFFFHVFEYLPLCFVLFLFYLLNARQGFRLFEYHEYAYGYEHALMHRCCDAVK